MNAKIPLKAHRAVQESQPDFGGRRGGPMKSPGTGTPVGGARAASPAKTVRTKTAAAFCAALAAVFYLVAPTHAAGELGAMNRLRRDEPDQARVELRTWAGPLEHWQARAGLESRGSTALTLTALYGLVAAWCWIAALRSTPRPSPAHGARTSSSAEAQARDRGGHGVMLTGISRGDCRHRFPLCGRGRPRSWALTRSWREPPEYLPRVKSFAHRDD